MHAVHTTPGFITSSRTYGEANKIVSVFTRDLGLIFATAQGIRLEKSKLRYAAQDYSFGTFSFVRGKEFWRLTSALEGKPNADTKQSLHTQKIIARIAFLLGRLLHGEEPHPELFSIVEAFMKFSETETNLTNEQQKSLESLTVLRILGSLGYIGHDPLLDGYIRSLDLSLALLDEVPAKRIRMHEHINKALRESQL